jgi:hypothetical protein
MSKEFEAFLRAKANEIANLQLNEFLMRWWEE